jgi:5'-nucleotidase
MIAQTSEDGMKTYEWILFDADDTLFHFDAFSGLTRMFSQFGVTFTGQHYQEYQAINKSLWVEYQQGLISAPELQQRRFNVWAEKLAVLPQDLNSAFLATMAEICVPIDGATHLLNALKGKARLGIITNGFTELQQARLERTGLSDHFELLVISEQVGVAKPHIDIFEHALSAMGNPARQQVLMVGDTPESDIVGGMNAGLDTCWVNVHKRSVPEGIIPVYEVATLVELEELLLGAY